VVEGKQGVALVSMEAQDFSIGKASLYFWFETTVMAFNSTFLSFSGLIYKSVHSFKISASTTVEFKSHITIKAGHVVIDFI